MRALRGKLVIAGFFIVGLLSFHAYSTNLLAAPRIEFELAMSKGTPPSTAQDWLAMMKNMDQQGLRIRSIETDDEPGISSSGKGDTALHRVVGIIAPNNVLLLPGATIRLGDKRGLASWIAKIKAGADDPASQKGAFGLTSKQLVELNTALALRLPFTSRGQTAKAVVKKIASSIDPEITLDTGIDQAFVEGGVVDDELLGVSAGTALAAVLRPLGLVAVPRVGPRGNLQLLVTDVRRSDQNWPIGWPTEKSASDAIPGLLKFLNVEINDTPLTDALAAIQQRLDVPFLYDYNGFARQRIDLQKLKATVPGGNTFYSRILDRILWPAKLSWEVRVDEADRPFIWVMTKIK